jgi:hypothetical protein
MAALESVVAALAAFLCMTCIRLASRWTPLNASSSAELRRGLAHANRVARNPRARPNHRQKFHELSIIQSLTWSLSDSPYSHQLTTNRVDRWTPADI